MASIVNYYSFMSADIPGAMVDINNMRPKEKYCLRGRCIDPYALFSRAKYYQTSLVKCISQEGEIITDTGIHKLGEISPDYQKYLDAMRNGIQSVVNWSILGTKDRGYYLNGDFYSQRKSFTAKIISKDEDLLVIQRMLKIAEGQYIWNNEEKVFVCWNSISRQSELGIKRRGKVADIPYSDFTEFNGSICKPF